MKAFEFYFRSNGSQVFHIGICLEAIRVGGVTEIGVLLGEKRFDRGQTIYPEKVRLNRFQPPRYENNRVLDCDVTWVKIPPREARPAHQFVTLSYPEVVSRRVLIRVKTKCSSNSSSPGLIEPVGGATLVLAGSGLNNPANPLSGIWTDALIQLEPGSGLIIQPAGLKQERLVRAIFFDPLSGLVFISPKTIQGRVG